MKRVILLALLVAGCDSATGTEYTDPDDLRILVVSGDGQEAPLVDEDGANSIAAQGPPASVLPEALVARIRDKSGGHANLPPTTVVNYVVPGTGCGTPWIHSVTPDDSAYVSTLWDRPDGGVLSDLRWHGSTWGMKCTLEARTFVGGEFRTDTAFTAIFTPGAVDPYYQAGIGLNRSSQPRTIPADRQLAEDRYGNPIPSCPAFNSGEPARTAGASWPACRDLYWDAGASPYRSFRVIDRSGRQIGKGQYYVGPSGALYLEAEGLGN